MSSAAGGASTSGGVSDFRVGDREKRGEYREGDGGTARQGGRTETGEGSGTGGGTRDHRLCETYVEGCREAIRKSSGYSGGNSGAMAFGRAFRRS